MATTTIFIIITRAMSREERVTREVKPASRQTGKRRRWKLSRSTGTGT